VFTVFCPFEAASKVLSENIPTARAVIIKNGGHFPHMESPKNVNEVISEWLEEKVNSS
jgi:pimeloyl-ACP methyl ester carboxylesterase